MRTRLAWAAALALLPGAHAWAQARSEVPIRQVTMHGGDRRYTVRLKVGGTEIETGLDTGSTGLRILPGVLKDGDAQSTGEATSETYGSGVDLVGEIGKGMLTLGDASGTVPIQLVKSKQCTARLPNCPAAKLPMSRYGIMGDGVSGAGFQAIIGINPGPNKVGNPLLALGATRWIVVLPRTDSESGRLILNPNNDELKDYVTLPWLGPRAAVRACIVNQATKASACGPTHLDTGAAAIGVGGGALGTRPWDGVPATLAFYDKQGPKAVESFTAGDKSQATEMNFVQQEGNNGTEIRPGLSPYLAFDVAYDTAKRLIGLKPKPAASGLPGGTLYPN